MKLVEGIGRNDGKYPNQNDGIPLKEYSTWRSILSKCKLDDKCHISENFKSYSYFYEWCQNQVGFGQAGYSINAEILSSDIKIYSENTCVFIPEEMSKQFRGGKIINHELPKGVCYHRVLKSGIQTYRARITKRGVTKGLKIYRSVDAALKAYQDAKREYLKELAEEYKDQIDPRAYNALINY